MVMPCVCCVGLWRIYPSNPGCTLKLLRLTLWSFQSRHTRFPEFHFQLVLPMKLSVHGLPFWSARLFLGPRIRSLIRIIHPVNVILKQSIIGEGSFVPFTFKFTIRLNLRVKLKRLTSWVTSGIEVSVYLWSPKAHTQLSITKEDYVWTGRGFFLAW